MGPGAGACGASRAMWDCGARIVASVGAPSALPSVVGWHPPASGPRPCEGRGGAVWSQVAIPRVAGSDARLSSWLWCCVCATGYTAGGPSMHWEVRSAPRKRLMTVNCFLWSSVRPFADCLSPGFAPPAAMCRPPRAPIRIILAGESSGHGAVFATRGGRL